MKCHVCAKRYDDNAPGSGVLMEYNSDHEYELCSEDFQKLSNLMVDLLHKKLDEKLSKGK